MIDRAKAKGEVGGQLHRWYEIPKVLKWDHIGKWPKERPWEHWNVKNRRGRQAEKENWRGKAT
jgi:hypothetical protein